MPPPLTAYEKGQIVGLFRGGLSARQISTELNKGHATISRFLKKYLANEDHGRKEGSGRPQKLSVQTQRAMGRQVLLDRFTTATKLQTDYGMANGPNKVSFNLLIY